MNENWVKLSNGSLLNTVSGIVWRGGRAWIFLLVLLLIAVPEMAQAKGPVVDGPVTSAWRALVDWLSSISN